MEKFVLQWHITHKCNLRCKHCYQDDYCQDLNLKQLYKIFYQFLDFCKEKKVKGHINFTGGEPFTNYYLFALLELCEKNNISFGILTNGTLLNNRIVKDLSKFKKLSFVQISIDGIPTTHNEIRGENNFEKALNGCKLLKKYNIQTMVSFTVHKKNYLELSKVIKIVKENKIDRFWTDRLIPIDNNKEINDSMILNTYEFQQFNKILIKEKKKADRNPFCKTTIHTNRALQFCYDFKTPIYQCSAGIHLLAILADGTLLPCRRLPIKIGNVLNSSILELYNSSEIIKDLNKNEIPNECNHCSKALYCRGGAKCLSYALNGNYTQKDVNCWF